MLSVVGRSKSLSSVVNFLEGILGADPQIRTPPRHGCFIRDFDFVFERFPSNFVRYTMPYPIHVLTCLSLKVWQ